MGLLRVVTLTGADEQTNFSQMARLSERFFNLVEWGVLYNPETAGKGGRYPSLEWLEKFAEKASKKRMRIALHLCGRAVKTLLEADLERPGLIKGEARRIMDLAAQFDRVQINTVAKMELVPKYGRLVEVLNRNENRSRVIFQWNERNKDVCLALRSEHAFEVLVDSSGGRGISPQGWPDLDHHDVRRPGFAGGLGPDNIVEQLKVLAEKADRRCFWVDMEGKLRDEQDRFDLERCEDVLTQVYAHELELRKADCKAWGPGTRDVSKLEGMWLDWWVARSRGLAWSLVIPPKDGIKTMQFFRSEGDYYSFQPSEDRGLATRILQAERIALVPAKKGENWTAYPVDQPTLVAEADDMLIAGLRAVVLKHYGWTVPKDMGDGL